MGDALKWMAWNLTFAGRVERTQKIYLADIRASLAFHGRSLEGVAFHKHQTADGLGSIRVGSVKVHGVRVEQEIRHAGHIGIVAIRDSDDLAWYPFVFVNLINGAQSVVPIRDHHFAVLLVSQQKDRREFLPLSNLLYVPLDLRIIHA